MLHQIKIPRKLHSFCKSKNCLNEVVTYYQLKVLSSNGFFKGVSIVERMIGSEICNSESSCYYKLRKCITLGIVKRVKNGYQLISYDSLFSLLGYDMTYNYKRKRKGFFKIHKIKNVQIDTIKEWIQYVDIRDNLKSQRISLYKSCRNNKTHTASLDHYTESSCREYFEQFNSKDPVENYNCYLQDLQGYIYSLLSCKGSKYKRINNTDITLSLKGICRILRLSNVSSAKKIVENLVNKGFLSCKKRLIRSNTNYSYIYYKVIDNIKYAILPNKIDYLV